MSTPYDRIPPPSRRRSVQPPQPPAPQPVPRPYRNGVHGQFVPPQPKRPQEDAFPPELQRGPQRGYPAPAGGRPPQPQYQYQQEPEYISQQRADLEEYYRQYQGSGEQPVPPPKKGKRSLVDTVILVATILVGIIGIAAAALNFVYARSSTQLPISISFMHVEIAAVLVLQIFVGVLVWRQK